MTPLDIVAHVQVRHDVRRPVASNVFEATDAVENDHYVRVRGRWRGHGEDRTYSLPWAAITALRWIREAA